MCELTSAWKDGCLTRVDSRWAISCYSFLSIFITHCSASIVSNCQLKNTNAKTVSMMQKCVTLEPSRMLISLTCFLSDVKMSLGLQGVVKEKTLISNLKGISQVAPTIKWRTTSEHNLVNCHRSCYCRS